MYSLSLFLHIVGALALFAGIGLEQAGLAGLRRAATTAQLREWLGLLGVLRRVEGPAAGLLVATGLHLGITGWGRHGWIVLGLFGLLAMAGLGNGVTRRRVAAIAQMVPRVGDDPIASMLRVRVDDPVLRGTATLRAALGLGVVFLMATKPGLGGSIATLGVALLAATAVAMPSARRRGPAYPI